MPNRKKTPHKHKQYQIGCPSHHLSSGRRLAIIQKPSVKTPKTFHDHGIAKQTKMIYQVVKTNVNSRIFFKTDA